MQDTTIFPLGLTCKAETTDPGRQDNSGQRVGEVRLDGLPHRRQFKGPFEGGGKVGRGIGLSKQPEMR